MTTLSTLTPDWNDIQSRPPGLDDGDDDTQLSQSDVLSYVDGQTVDLGSGSQVDGYDIVTIDTDMDSLAGISVRLEMPCMGRSGWGVGVDYPEMGDLNCAHGEVGKWDNSNGVWDCASDLDTDTTLGQSDVLNFVNGQTLSLGLGTQVNGAHNVHYDYAEFQTRPPGLDD